MSRSTRRFVAFFLLLAFGLWLVFTVFPFGETSIESDAQERNSPVEVYEPKFKPEGNLVFLDSLTTDTLIEIVIELAIEPEEVQYGMMYRKSMGPLTGMLFFMGVEDLQSFWMKNTYVPLDIIYINNKKEVVSIQKNTKPLSEESLPSKWPASMVLEVTAGFSDEHGIGKGTKIRFSRY